MIKLRREINPDLIFLPSLNDFHQDHHVISCEGIRAFKHNSILGYEEPWNMLGSSANFFVKIDEKYLEKKIIAVEKYASQSKRKFIDGEKIKSLASIRGLQADADFAEAFEVIRFFD
jgi:LmbE family N-acetylglucosaminyl deacetylase